MPQSAKRPLRVQVGHRAILSTSDGKEREVVVKDVSMDGFRIEGHAGLKPGEQVYLKVGKQDCVAAEIKWVRDSEAGGTLLDPPKV